MASKRFTRLAQICTDTGAEGGEELLQLEGRLERTVHFGMLVWRHFVRNRCLVRASSLAYTSLLALIPLLALVISVSSSLLKDKNEEVFYQAIASLAPPPVDVNSNSTALHQVYNWRHPAKETASRDTTNQADNIVANDAARSNAIVTVSNTLEVIAAGGTNLPAPVVSAGADTNSVVVAVGGQINDQKEIARWLRQFVQNTQGPTLGVTGLLAFALVAIIMLSRVEETFNDIWGVTRGRNWLTRFMLYWLAITLGPVVLLVAISLMSGSHFATVTHYFEAVPLGGALLKLLPLVLLWITFAIVYVIVPNTRVNFSAAAIGGLIAGTVWHVNNEFGFLYVSRVVTNSKIYGSIGLIPVFMLGLYFSWAILLFGAQVAYCFQNRAAYLQDKIADNVNHRGREFVALRIMTLLGQRFQLGMRPPTVLQISTELGVPSRLTQQVLRVLIQAHLVTEVGRAESAYAPARPLDSINVHHVLLAMRTSSGQELPQLEAPALAEIYGEFTRIEEAERNASERISLIDLVRRTPALAALSAPEKSEPKRELINIPQIETIHLPLGRDEGEPEIAADPFLGTEAEKAMESASHTAVPAEPQPAPDLQSPEPTAEPELAAADKSPRREPVQPQERDFPL